MEGSAGAGGVMVGVADAGEMTTGPISSLVGGGAMDALAVAGGMAGPAGAAMKGSMAADAGGMTALAGGGC